VIPFWNLLLQLYAVTTLAALLGLGLRELRRRGWAGISAAAELRIQVLLVIACFVLPFVPSPFQDRLRFEPLRKSMAATSFQEFDRKFPAAALVSPALGAAEKSFPWKMLLVVLALGCFVLPVVELFRLRRLLRTSLLWRRIGRVRLVFSDQLRIPLSAWWAGRAWVVLPQGMQLNPGLLQISVAHEIQHHRQRDTLWLYAFFLLRALTPLHPLRSLWSRAVEESQEEACDTALVDQGRVDRRAYARCLLEMAEISAGEGRRPACAAGLSSFSGRNNLKRRIEHMYEQQKIRRWVAPVLALVMGLTLSLASFASGNWIVDQRVSLSQAERMAEMARKGSDFPIVVNESVLRELNRYLGTAQGRAFLEQGKRNMETHRSVLREAAGRYGIPQEIFAVGMIESGFRNLPARANPIGAAGIWQFIPSTARNYGLRVDDALDERLHVELSTDAAFRYLLSNRLRFQDWLLAAMAYNIGEQALEKAIRRHGTRDPWELLRKGVKTDKDYLPRLMAMVLILRNPDSIR
jgi:membrane-bound lytic murein transglycosylase D